MDNFLGINKWHIRLTFQSDIQTVENFIRTLGSKYIICDELTHYHCYLEGQHTKRKITLAIKEQLKLSGNEQLSVVMVRKPKQMKKYILKDGHYVYNGFEPTEIEILRKCSNKKGTAKFQLALEKLIENYMEKKNTSFTRFCEQYVQLKVEYGQTIYGSHIKAFCLKIKFKKNPDSIPEYISELFRN